MDWNKLEELSKRFEELGKKIVDPGVIARQEEYKEYLREHGNIAPVARKYAEYRGLLRSKQSNQEMLEKEGVEEELKELAREENGELEDRIKVLTRELGDFLKGKHKVRNSVIMEIRAGTGGDEAALFAADLFRMYTRYAERKGWKIEYMDSHATGLKGFKEVVFTVEGQGAYDSFMFESGTHRVQRIPVTESSGRIHTSTATVAVLPQVEDIELRISHDELRVDTYRASGKGGQHLQKTDSAVRITHLPTGIVVQCQDERSQTKNKVKAMKFLRAKVYDKMKTDQDSARSDKRKKQVGSGERSEKIRTYNYPQNRITDHRAGVSLYNLETIIDGSLDELIKQVREKVNDDEVE